jgi:beta-1,2-mannobiose phosphorylase / 1,2-beta-oligomannan phosphorylase
VAPRDRPSTVPFQLERLGLIMEADPSRQDEAWGVLNPAAVRGPDGELYLFPRLVDERNYSRIGLARVRFGPNGDPVGVERLGVVLEPSAPYELRPSEETGGCEDPRVVYVAALGHYVMTYTAWGDRGPRLAVAVSEDLRTWRRLGLLEFLPAPDPHYGVEFQNYDNKDGIYFPEPVVGPDGEEALAILHRPVYGDNVPNGIEDPRPSIWLSYCRLADARHDLRNMVKVSQHHLLMTPTQPWEALRIGAGTPPLLTPHGWLAIYHGVAGNPAPVPRELQPVEYCAGALVLDRRDPRRILYRSPEPILRPETSAEVEGLVPNVVFPTGVDPRGDGRVDVYYGMADLRIGVASLRVPTFLPTVEEHRDRQRIMAAASG